MELFKNRHDRFNYLDKLKRVTARRDERYASQKKYKNQISTRSVQTFVKTMLREIVPTQLFGKKYEKFNKLSFENRSGKHVDKLSKELCTKVAMLLTAIDVRLSRNKLRRNIEFARCIGLFLDSFGHSFLLLDFFHRFPR